jgi:hypothetical protein
MRKSAQQQRVYVVYPAALFDGWEVVKEQDAVAEHEVEPASFDTREKATAYAEAQAATSGGGIVKLENWFGDTEGVWEVPPQTDRCPAPALS